MLQQKNVSDFFIELEQTKDRLSNSTVNTEGQCLSPLNILTIGNFGSYNHNSHLFRNLRGDGEISGKIIQKSIQWIQSTCFIKNVDFETMVLAISLFYAYVNHSTISKKSIEPAICACLFLASKMTSNCYFKMADILNLIDNRQCSKNILEHEQNILAIFDFSLSIKFPILDLLDSVQQTESQREKTKLLTQLFLLKQPCLLYDVNKAKQILEIASMEVLETTGKGAKIRKMLKKNNCQHLISKYQSNIKFSIFLIQNDQSVYI